MLGQLNLISWFLKVFFAQFNSDFPTNLDKSQWTVTRVFILHAGPLIMPSHVVCAVVGGRQWGSVGGVTTPVGAWYKEFFVEFKVGGFLACHTHLQSSFILCQWMRNVLTEPTTIWDWLEKNNFDGLKFLNNDYGQGLAITAERQQQFCWRTFTHGLAPYTIQVSICETCFHHSHVS